MSRRATASEYKASLHASGRCRIGFSEHYLRRPDRIITPGDERAIVKWQRLGFDRERPTIPVFSALVPWFEVLPDAPYTDGRSGYFDPEPPAGFCSEFTVLLGRSGVDYAGWPGERAMDSRLVGQTTLANGETMWLIAATRELDPTLARQLLDLKANLQTPRKAVAAMEHLSTIISGAQDGRGVLIDVAIRPNGFLIDKKDVNSEWLA